MLIELWEFIVEIFLTLQENLFFNIGLLLLVGVVGGNVAEKLKLPRVTGYIMAGMILGPGGTGLIHKSFLYEMKIVKVLALGFIGFNIGLELKKSTLKLNGSKVLFITFFQALVTFVVVFLAVYIFASEYKVVYALILASIATVTTPAPIVACMRSYKTKGSISELVCPIVAIDDIIGIVLFSLVLPFSVYLAGHEAEIVSFSRLFLGPILNIGFSSIVGFILGYITLLVLRYYKLLDNISLVLIIFTAILFAVGIGETFDTSDILLPLVMGMVISNNLESGMVERIKGKTDAIVLPLLLVFFTVSGADLSIKYLSMIGIIGTVYIVTRIIGKVVGTSAGARLLGEDKTVSNYLGLTLVPQGGVALDMAILVEVRFLQIATDVGATEFEKIGTTIFTIILGAIIFYKIIGEIVVKRAFKKAGEIYVSSDLEEHHVV